MCNKKEELYIILYIVSSINYSIVNKQSGRCDNCGRAHFNSSVGNGKFIRECSNCGMKKSI
ncbi:hypothetical protein MKX65_24730 [Robertmurraya sp. FSL R5-0851]|uniref:hypothetical protein n=1 Tax=Robertmurraya sp. FSL R5-0851 TaxID=2921584 RepID=UPI0030F86BC2